MLSHLGHKTYVIGFIFLVLLMIASAAIIGVVLYRTNNLPAPPVTGRVSFNEKLFDFHNNSLPESIDILAVGSSMTLNNLATSIVIKNRSVKFRNFSSWGLTISEISHLIRFLVERYNPKIIINVSGPMDFYLNRSSPDFFAVKEVQNFLDDNNLIYLYLKYLNPHYLAKYSRFIRRWRTTNTIYESLSFDTSGGVSLSIAKKDVIKERWNAEIKDTEIDPMSYVELHDLASYLKKKKIKLIMVQSPIRGEVLDSNMSEVSAHWMQLENISKKTSFSFFNLHSEHELKNQYFVDSTHLNVKGSELFTEQFLNEVRDSGLSIFNE